MKRFTIGFAAGYLVGAIAGLKRITWLFKLTKLRKPVNALATLKDRVEAGRYDTGDRDAGSGKDGRDDSRARRAAKAPAARRTRTASSSSRSSGRPSDRGRGRPTGERRTSPARSGRREHARAG